MLPDESLIVLSDSLLLFRLISPREFAKYPFSTVVLSIVTLPDESLRSNFLDGQIR